MITFTRGGFDAHLCALERVFLLARREGIIFKAKKCQFFRQMLVFVGILVSKEGIAPDPVKVAAVKDFAVPTNIGHLRSFLGLCSYF